MTTTEQPKTRTLPLWKGALDELRKDGVSHGKTFPAKWFEEQLSCKRGMMRFSLAISLIRQELLKDGFYLSGRGQGGNQFVILPPENHAPRMASYQRGARKGLMRAVILGTNTRMDTLTECQRRRHEAMLERVATRAALMGRSLPTLPNG